MNKRETIKKLWKDYLMGNDDYYDALSCFVEDINDSIYAESDFNGGIVMRQELIEIQERLNDLLDNYEFKNK